MKYTAIEILKMAEIETPEEKLGAIAITIGGVNVNTPDHVINIQDAKTVSVVVGSESKEVTLPEDAPARSEGVVAVKEAKGKEATEKAEALAKAKVEAESTPAPEEKESEDKG